MRELAEQAGKKLLELAATHPEAVEALGHAVENVMASQNPVETARRAALATASAEASEEALKRILGRS
jgi:hypothetical protein